MGLGVTCRVFEADSHKEGENDFRSSSALSGCKIWEWRLARLGTVTYPWTWNFFFFLVLYK